jgi:lipopolysaccharide transport system permease protein
MRNYGVSINDMVMSLVRNRSLIFELTKREVIGRYKGSFIGIGWSFVNPLIMIAVYTFVLSIVLKARWAVDMNESRTDFAVILFAGMLIFGLLEEPLTRSPELMLSNVNYVKKVIFPLEIMPYVIMGSALFHAILGMLILLLAQLIIYNNIPWTIIFFPLVILPLILAATGISWLLASLGVYLRDIQQFTKPLTSAMMFLSPVFYPISAVPESYRSWVMLNPLAHILEEGRNTLIFGIMPDWPSLGIALVAGLVLAWIGFWWFQKTRKGFSDVI